MKTVDILLGNAHVLTMDEELHQYNPGAVAVTGDSIVAVGADAGAAGGVSSRGDR